MGRQKIKERIDKLLDEANLRRTSPRRTILEVLLGVSRPKTADEIVSVIGKTSPDKVTVYRTLESFLDAGLIHKVFLQDRTWHFELADRCSEKQCHPHFTCKNCGDTHCMPEISVPMVNGENGFVIEHQRVQLEGLCPDCS